MKPIQVSQVSTVILGSWNPRIFKPLWIKTNLFGLTDIKDLQGMVNFDEMEFGFQYHGIHLFPRTNLIEINFEGYDNEKANLASSTIIKILELLPQTPLKALGVNIRYILDKKTEIPFVKTISKINCNYLEFDLTQIKQTRSHKDYQINIISDILKDSIQTNFNFHYPNIAPFSSDFIMLHYKESQKILINGK
jgi:hypothetical protein